MSFFDDDYLEGLEKQAAPADFTGEFPPVWAMTEDDGGVCVTRPEDPFSELKDRIVHLKSEEEQIEQDLKARAQDVAEMQDLMDQSAVPVQEGIELVLGRKAAMRKRAEEMPPPIDPIVPVQDEIADLTRRVKDHRDEESELRCLLEGEAADTAGLIDTFLGRQASRRRTGAGAFPRKVLPKDWQEEEAIDVPGLENLEEPKDVKKAAAKKDTSRGMTQDEKTYAYEFRIDKAKKGQEVMSPNGPGKIEDLWDDDATCTVRLSSGELRAYRINRLRLTKAASRAIRETLAAKRQDDLDEILASCDVFGDSHPATPGQLAGVDSARAGYVR